MIEMGVDPRLLQLSLSTDSGDMRYLTAKEMQQYAIITSTGTEAITGIVGKPVVSAIPSAEHVTPVSEPERVAPSKETVEDQARKFVADYHAAWPNSNSAAMTFMEKAYGAKVRFYGKEISHADVLGEKATFAKRWPQRAYSVIHGSESLTCNGIFKVAGTVEWFASSIARGKTSSGAARFELEWDPVTSKIISENGKVIMTDKGERTPKRIISQWYDQNGACRGGSGNEDETWRACDRREDISAKLAAVGWCYGRPGEYGYQMSWHVCGQ